MHAKYDMRRVNHSVEYRSADGTTNNMAESYFSRLRRMQVGQYHRFSSMHLHAYAIEAAFREDRRRWWGRTPNHNQLYQRVSTG